MCFDCIIVNILAMFCIIVLQDVNVRGNWMEGSQYLHYFLELHVNLLSLRMKILIRASLIVSVVKRICLSMQELQVLP